MYLSYCPYANNKTKLKEYGYKYTKLFDNPIFLKKGASLEKLTPCICCDGDHTGHQDFS
jgi:hypothetical protein